jgi:hypothetical protein
MGDLFKGRADFYEEGGWNVACSLCGRKRKGSYMEKNWEGLWRCPEHNEPRQPQDFVRAVIDIVTPPYVQVQTDIDIQVCTAMGCSAIPGWAMPGCMMPNRPALPLEGDLPFYILTDPTTGQPITDPTTGYPILAELEYAGQLQIK